MLKTLTFAGFLIVVSLLTFDRHDLGKYVAPCIRTDKTEKGPSAYPLSIDPSEVGRHSDARESSVPGLSSSEVLEYRVWMSPERGSEPINGSRSYYAAFAQYEAASDYAKRSRGALNPVAAIRLKSRLAAYTE